MDIRVYNGDGGKGKTVVTNATTSFVQINRVVVVETQKTGFLFIE